jgi:hypothetical protein
VTVEGPNPSGKCMCGCGERTPIATMTCKRLGHVKGQPCRFIRGHNTKKGPNVVRHLSDGTTAIVLERRKSPNLECIIETADYEIVKDCRWSPVRNKRTFYAETVVGEKHLSMHQVLLPGFKTVDHKDHDGLNNRRSNLRPATTSQNNWNVRKTGRKTASKYKGVSRRPSGKYRSCISACNAVTYLGTFTSEEDAAQAYDAAAIRLHGEFAVLNFPKRRAA